MKLAQRIALGYIKAKLNLLSAISKKKAAEKPMEDPVEIKKPEEKKIFLCETLENFWDYDNSEFIQRHLARGHSMSRKHAFCMHAFVKNYWRPYWGDDTTIEDLTKPELDDFFFYLYNEKDLCGETVNKVINSAGRCTRWLYENNKIKFNPLFGIERFKAEHAERDIGYALRQGDAGIQRSGNSRISEGQSGVLRDTAGRRQL